MKGLADMASASNGLYNYDLIRTPFETKLNNHGAIIAYNPSLKGEILSYLYLTPPQDKFMDAVTNGLSLAAGVGPALKGLAAARTAIKYAPNAVKKFVIDSAKGLAREGIENVITDKVDSEILNHALAAEDVYRVSKLLHK